MFYFIICFPIIIILNRILGKPGKNGKERLIRTIYYKFFYSATILFFIFCYTPFLVSSFYEIKFNAFKIMFDIVSLIFSIFILVLMAASTLATTIIICRNYKHTGFAVIRKRFGVLFLPFKDNLSCYLYWPVYLIKQAILVVIVIFVDIPEV